MRTKIRLQICVLALLLLSASFSFAVNIYRGLNEKKGKPVTAPSEFRIDDDKDGKGGYLSTFDDPENTDRRCNLPFVVEDDGTVRDFPGYTAKATPRHGDGHWSIYLPPGKEDAKAREEFSKYAKKNMDHILCRE